MVSHLANDVPSPQKFLHCGGGDLATYLSTLNGEDVVGVMVSHLANEVPST